MPVPNKSMRLAPHDTAAGLEAIAPPTDCHAFHPLSYQAGSSVSSWYLPGSAHG